jgi:hypothetical protein
MPAYSTAQRKVEQMEKHMDYPKVNFLSPFRH